MSKRTLKLGGFAVPCTDLEEERKHALVRHEYPGHSGADLESLGWKATEHKLKATFTPSQAADWTGIEGFLKNGQTAVLDHFEYGEIDVHIESVSIRHDHRIGTIEVDLVVVEDGVDQVAVRVRPSAQDVVAGASQGIVDVAIALVADQFLPGSIPAPDLTDSNWLEKLGDLGSKTNALVGLMRNGIGRLDGMIAAVSSPVSAALNALAFGADLPSQFALRVAKVCDLLQGKVAGAASPSASASKFMRDLDSLVASFRGTDLEGSVRVLSSLQGARTIATVMANDEDLLRSMQAYESSQSFDQRGRWIAQGSVPKSQPSNAIQMAALIALARQQLQTARPWVADPFLLDRIAVALQDQYHDRLIEFEKLREIVVNTPTPLHIICHREGLPYNAAARVASLNPQIRNPTFAQGRILIYAP